MNAAVIGLGFGDEGKGRFTDYLCSQYPKSLVVRFNGGHQAGHTVVNGIKRHVFSNFGSGSFRGMATYWSRFCTVDPVGFVKEYRLLIDKGVKPIIYIDGRCEITTPYDKEHNYSNAMYIQNGTCAVGFGPTVERKENNYSLTFLDLFYRDIFYERISKIGTYYKQHYMDLGSFVSACDRLIKCALPVDESILYMGDRTLIFEGAQGLLLDQRYGFFPNVTRSNTGITNILSFIGIKFPKLFLITRAYQTRHGKGFMTNKERECFILPDQFETNVKNEQGEFRRTMLDVSLLEYAIRKHSLSSLDKSLVITCLDHLGKFQFTYKNEVVTCNDKTEFITKVAGILKIPYVFASSSPEPNEIEFIEL